MSKISFVLSLAVLFGCGAMPAFMNGEPQETGMAKDPVQEVAVFQEDGSLLRPSGYREWIFVGAPVTPNDMNGGHAAFPEFHSVYVDRRSYEAFKKNGSWRQGTVLVKELSTVGSKSASSGKGYFMGKFTGVEVAVKDEKRFPKEPGGWAYFRFTDEKGGPVHRSAKALPTESCATCHNAGADDDLVFTQYYPVLSAAKGFGQGRPEDR